jgi:nucleoside phosphorylase
MKLGVIAALKTELGPSLHALRPSSTRVVEHVTGYLSGPFVFAAGGVGSRAAAAAALVVADEFKPHALLSVGFCGALRDDFDTADLVVGGTPTHPADAALLDLARAAAPKARDGTVLTVPKVLLGADEKKAAASRTGAAVVDMEADAVAVAARARGLGFLSVKVVIDTPSEPLASSYAGCWRVLLDVLSNPMTIGQMIYDSKRVKLAAERLRDFFVALKEKIPADPS